MSSTIKKDGKDLKQALEAKDKKAVVQIISKTTSTQRQEIRKYYKSSYGEELINVLEKKLSSDFQKLCIALFYDQIEYDCKELHDAMEGLGTNEATLNEIIGTRPKWMIEKIKTQYEKIFKKNLIEDVKDETSGLYRDLLVALLEGKRNQTKSPDMNQCGKCAQELHDVRTKKKGSDKNYFVKVFSSKSKEEMLQIAKDYHKINGETLLTAIKEIFSGNDKKLLKAVLYGLLNPGEYFARRVKKSVKGAGTNEKMLNRVIVSRNEIDMPYIRAYYQKVFKKDMIDDIIDDTSGEYQDLLIALAKR